MKSFRSTLAAAVMLVAPTAALLVSQPAAAQHRAIVAAETYGYGHGYRHHRDQRPPQIVDVTPDQGDRVDDRGRTRITARVVDYGSGVQSVALRLDGRDVSHRVRFDGQDVRYRDDLAPGRHVAELAVRDRAGNVTRHSWSFVVVDRDRHDRRGDRYGYYGQPQRW